MSKGIFITGTDTNVGKTIVTWALGVVLQEKKIDVGVMKPVQCAGDDARFLKKNLNLQDDIKDINPYYAAEPLSPHLAFSRQKQKISIKKIESIYKKLSQRHDFMLVEGAGGLMVPITPKYLMVDLIKDLELDVIIVTRLGLGTINHTLLTIKQAQDFGLTVCGVIFNQVENKKLGLVEQDNPKIIEKISGVPVLGIIPYLKNHPNTNTRCLGGFLDGLNLDGILGVEFVEKNRERLVSDDKKYLWHPFTQMKDWVQENPLVIDRARGSYLVDVDGNKYLDGVSSLWVNVHGHNHPVINKAIKEQLNKLEHSTLLGLSNTPSIELAKALVKITPKGLEKVFYSDSGSTSVEIAIKMAYQYWQNVGQTKKINIVHLDNSYHGDTLGSVSIGGIDLFHKVYRNLIFKTIKLDFPDSLDKFEAMLKKKCKTIAALVVEPMVQGAAGMIVWPKGILKRMAQLCKQYDVFLICDEVATGFGRTGKMFACEHENVKPDILCLAKGITGGYLPLAATLTTKKIFDGFCFEYADQKTFFHGHTYTGNPLACVAALANLEIFRQEKTLMKLQPKIKFLKRQLKRFYDLPCVGDVRQKGFMIGIELQKEIGVQVCQKTRERGVILRPLGNVIVLMPPLSISQKELKKLLDVTYWAIEEIVSKNEQ
ncbi:Adenosylmethionine-8-amino-7-oxononanoate aminotransferase [hydrothermal vent metagenome]|uniref:Adenosylmethionine-8-amino-7-oxononanoate aminotransferase n=1 Tax=hydrothermal vent metagenome TaxID=652676 RepID=A0A3B1DP89_9ZZZZ